jgi:arsenate reductase
VRRKILYLCVGNASRSQMAEGFTRQYYPDDFEPYSAGMAPAGVHPFAVLVMQESGIDISDQFSKSVYELPDVEFDIIVTLCDEVREACPIFRGKARRYHFSLPDPAVTPGDSAEVLEAFRKVRSQIHEYLIPFLEQVKSRD